MPAAEETKKKKFPLLPLALIGAGAGALLWASGAWAGPPSPPDGEPPPDWPPDQPPAEGPKASLEESRYTAEGTVGFLRTGRRAVARLPARIGALIRVVPEADRAKVSPGQKVKAVIAIKNTGNAAGKFKVYGGIYRASTGDKVGQFLCDGAEWPVRDLAAGQSLPMTFYSAAAWPSGYAANEVFTASWSIWVTDPATGIEVDKLEVYDREAIVNKEAVPAAPGAPYEVSQYCSSPGYATLTIGWSPVSGATSYEIYHSSGERKGTTSGTQFTLYNLPSGVNGAYLTLYIVACNAAGCSGAGSSRQFYLKPCQAPAAPGAPYKVSQSCVSRGYCNLTIGWSSVYGATQYEVYHSSGERKGTTSGTQLTLYNIPCGTTTVWTLTLYVVACNAAGCSGKGSSGTISLNSCP